MRFDWRHRTVVAVLCLQLMLMQHTYRSTDFEVHRNWLAITYSLPISKWYYEATSEWTLDYPPLFAWFEYAMARVAYTFDRKMLSVSNLDYDSNATVLFQRLSVCASSMVLVAAMLYATRTSKDNVKGLTTFFLVVANAGLIMVDNIHFQYNSILLGILIWSLLMLKQQHNVLAGILFTLLLNMKHLFAYLGPVYFIHLWKHYVLPPANSSSNTTTSTATSSSSGTGSRPGVSRHARGWTEALLRLVLLGSCVLAVCAASFGPFIAMGQMKQVMSRLFPFGRGLCHSYWAPNAWALYSFLDKLAAAAAVKAGLLPAAPAANMAGGIVGVSSYVVLPNVGAGVCAVLVLLAMLPCLEALWKASDAASAARLMPAAVAYANLCGFMFGYHVHEKAALTVVIPLVLAAVADARLGQLYVLLSTAAHVGIFPLLFEVQEVPIRWLLTLVYYMCCLWGLASSHQSPQQQQMPSQAAKTAGGGSHQVNAGTGPASAAGKHVPVTGVRTRRQAAAEQKHKQQQAYESAGVDNALKAPYTGSGTGTPPVGTPSAQPGIPGAAHQSPGTCVSLHECCAWLPWQYRAYLGGLVALELYCTLGHSMLFGQHLPFVPLMLTSVYCALAFTWSWVWLAMWFMQLCSTSSSEAGHGGSIQLQS
eukprot:gene3940-4194_t